MADKETGRQYCCSSESTCTHNNECRGGSCASCSHREGCSCPRAALAGRGNLQSYDWLKGINGGDTNQLVEVMFKNTRKSYYLNTAGLQLHSGDAVVVEGSPGQDLGKVTMTGPLVALQMKRANLRSDFEPKRLYRHATENDLERFRQARDKEHDTMIRSRKIAAELGLKMKIGDVEYQGDGHKAIFYYIADERVDFRKLIRILAETFGVRVEMKQIGARQEAGRIGGIGPCGRPLCCATFLTRFASVGTGSARLQDISMNPQKLAGQCAKLKCCLNFEVDTYVEASKKLPPKDVVLQTQDQDYYYFKADILKREVSYTTAKNQPVNMVTLPASRAFEIIALNKNGVKPEQLAKEEGKAPKAAEFVDLVGQDSLTRFDKSRRGKKRRGNGEQDGNGGRQNRNGGKGQDKASKPQQEKDRKNPSPKEERQKSQSEKNKNQAQRGGNKKQRSGRQQEGNGRGNRNEGEQKGQQPNAHTTPRQPAQNGANSKPQSVGEPVSQSAIRRARAKKEK